MKSRMMSRPAEWAGEKTKRGLGLLVRWGIIVAVSALVLWMIRDDVIRAPFQAHPTGLFAFTPRTPAVGLTAVTLLALGTAWFLIKGDVHGIARGGGGTRIREAMGAKMIGVRGEVTGTIARTGIRVTNSATDVLTPVWAAMAAPLAAAWWARTDLGAVAWVVALLGLPAGWLIGRRVGALGHVNLTWRDVTDREFISPEFAIPGALLGGLTGWALTDWLGGVVWPAVITMAATGAVALPASIAAFLLITQVRAKRRHAGVVAAALGIKSNILKSPVQRWHVKTRPFKRNQTPEIRVIPPLDEKIINHLPELTERVAQHAPEYQVDWDRTGPRKGVRLIPCGPEEFARRQLQEDFEGLVVAIEDLPDTHPARPKAQRYTLAKSVGASAAGRIDELAKENARARLVEWNPDAHSAVVAQLPEGVLRLRKTIADKLGAYPHDVELTATMADGHIDQVHIYRYPATKLSDEEVLTAWKTKIVPSIPGGNLAWDVRIPQHGQVLLSWRKKPELPKLAPLADLMPASFDDAAGDWANIPIGVDAGGNHVCINLALGPHEIVAGPTNSGKTVALLADMVGRLGRGHQLVVIDPIKMGLDFLPLQPWATAWAETLEEAQRAIELVYEEVTRRKHILKQYRAGKWSELPRDVRRKEGIKPLTVLIDEVGSLLMPMAVTKGLEKDDPLVTENTRQNAAKAVIGVLIGKIAREARFTGVFLALATQRPDAAIMGGSGGSGGELRSNLTTAVHLAKPGSVPGHESLRMVFNDPEVMDAAISEFKMLDDGKSLGIAVVAAEGGSALGFRVAYQKSDEIPGLLDSVGVPPVAEQWDLSPQEGMEAAGTIIAGNTPAAPQPSEPRIIDAGTVELSLDDLEAFADEPGEGDPETVDDPFTTPLQTTEDPFAEPVQPARPSRPAPPRDPFEALADPNLYVKQEPADDDDFDFKM